MPGFRYGLSDGVGYFTIDEFERGGKVSTCFSSRIGGVSESPYESLNLGFKSGEAFDNVRRNFARLCDSAGFKVEDLVLSDQVHGDICRSVGYGDRGSGIVSDGDIHRTDALTTDSRGVALCIFTADCVPVFLYDPENAAIGLCHAGWRGVVNGIVSKTVSEMKRDYGSRPSSVMAAIGPSIGPCCFRVGRDLADRFRGIFGGTGNIVIEDDYGFRIDLWEAVKTQLVGSGIRVVSIIESGLCTSCRESLFFSYRRDGASTGRMASIIQLR